MVYIPVFDLELATANIHKEPILMAALYSLTAHRKCDFNRVFEVKISGNIQDLTGYSFTARISPNYHSDDVTNLTTAIVSAGDGTFSISLTDAQTETLKPGKYVYDVIMTDTGGFKTKLLEGDFIVEDSV